MGEKNYHGLQGNVSPSFTPDLKELDEEGIRHDVRHNINKGVFSVFCQTEICDMTFEERKRFVEIVCEEAKGKALVSMFSGIIQSTKILNCSNTLRRSAAPIPCSVGP